MALLTAADVTELAADVLDIVGIDPVSITVSRSTKIRSGRGYSTSAGTAGPYSVVIAETGQRKLERLFTTPGELREDSDWLLIGGATVDVRPDDTFTAAPYGSFRVSDVKPARYLGTTVGILAQLERLS